MYPFTLGANIGTTITGIMAALVADTASALQVALCHLVRNRTLTLKTLDQELEVFSRLTLSFFFLSFPCLTIMESQCSFSI